MLDFVKSQVYDSEIIERLKNEPLLEWVSDTDKFNKFDNEIILTKTIKHYEGIFFAFFPNRVDVLFKPHYYFNSGLHNANDFSARHSIEIFKDFEATFGINLENFNVVNLEFGLNVISPIDIKLFMACLAMHGKNQFLADTSLAFSKKGFKFDRHGIANKYKFIKAYAKGFEFPQYADADMFRFEVKSKESKYIKSIGINTFADFLNPAIYYTLADILLDEWEAVLLLDITAKTTQLPLRDQYKLQTYLNPLNWFKYLHQNRNSFLIHKKEYEYLIGKTGWHLKSQMTERIETKLDFLLHGAISSTNFKPKNVALSTVYINGNCNAFPVLHFDSTISKSEFSNQPFLVY